MVRLLLAWLTYTNITTQTLHSTMVRLLQRPGTKRVSTLINFTFHYGQIATRGCQRQGCRCEYFTFHYGQIATSIVAGGNKGFYFFTFHYGQIATKKCFCCWKKENGFTFHYGQIATCHWHNDTFGPIRLYIPLWSDCYSGRLTLTMDSLYFTFHYGQIATSTTSA